MRLSYVVPLRAHTPAEPDFFHYLDAIAADAQVILIDGSQADVFDAHAARCGAAIVHVPVDADFARCRNGKVAGVLTGLRRAAFEHVIIADEDVRYDAETLRAVTRELDTCDVVR